MTEESQTTRFWLDIAQLVTPVLTALVLGWWITRKNEKFKDDLARKFTDYQTRLTNQHQARLSAINRMSPIVGRIRDLLTAIQIRDMGMPQLPGINQNNADLLREQTTILREIMAETSVYFDEAIIKSAGTAYSYSLLLIDDPIPSEITGERAVEMQTFRIEMREIATSAINDLTEGFRKIVSPDNK